jgi:alkaline phosphatase D
VTARAGRVPRRVALASGASGAAGLFGCGRSTLSAEGAEPVAGDAFAAIVVLREDRGTFPLGVSAGGMRDDQVTLWTRCTVGERLTLHVYVEGDDPTEVDALGALELPPSATGFVHVRLQGLVPGAHHRYVFRNAAARSAVGRFRAAPAPDFAGPLLVGATACTNRTVGSFRTLLDLAREPVDLFLQLGDLSYNDGARTPQDFQQFWFQTLGDPGYQAVLGSTGSYFTADDHEITDNYDAEWLATNDATVLTAGRQAMFDHLPLEPNELGGIWQSYRWGRTAEFFVLDCRSERRPSTARTPHPIYLSDAQMAWLKGSLAASRARFKIILNSVPIARFPTPPAWSQPFDRWEGYAAQREELLSFIAGEPIAGVWFVAGDFHLGLVHRVETLGRDSRLWEIAVGPGCQIPRDPASLVSSQILHMSAENAYTTLRFDPDTGSVQVRFVNEFGKVLFDAPLTL